MINNFFVALSYTFSAKGGLQYLLLSYIPIVLLTLISRYLFTGKFIFSYETKSELAKEKNSNENSRRKFKKQVSKDSVGDLYKIFLNVFLIWSLCLVVYNCHLMQKGSPRLIAYSSYLDSTSSILKLDLTNPESSITFMANIAKTVVNKGKMVGKNIFVILLFLIGLSLLINILAYTTAHKKNEYSDVGTISYCLIAGWKSLVNTFITLKSTVRIFLIVIVFCFASILLGEVAPIVKSIRTAIVSLSNEVSEIKENQKIIKEQEEFIKQNKTVIKNLSLNAPLMKFSLIGKQNGEYRYFFAFYDKKDQSLDDYSAAMICSFPDNHPCLETSVWNFDYSEVADGKINNVAIPYRVYSEYTSPDDGTLLVSKDGSFLAFQRNKDNIFGVSEDVYNTIIQRLSEELSDINICKTKGIMTDKPMLDLTDELRSQYNDAIHREISIGSIYEIQVNNNGGIIITQSTSERSYKHFIEIASRFSVKSSK